MDACAAGIPNDGDTMATLSRTHPISTELAPPSAAPAAPAPVTPGFIDQAREILTELQESVRAILSAVPGEVVKAVDVECVFGVAHPLGWRIFQIAKAEDSLAVVRHLPVRESMQRFLKAASRRRVPTEVVERASRAMDEFDRFVDEHAEDRPVLDAMVRAHLPEARAEYELESKRAAFNAMSRIKGLANEVISYTGIYHPSADGRRVDGAAIVCELGLRRVRPETRIVLGSGSVTSNPVPRMTLDGRSCDGPTGTLLQEFSTTPLPRIETRTSGCMVYSCLGGQEVGMRSAMDLVMADRRVGSLPRYWEPGTPHVRGGAHITDKPANRLVLDMFLHKDVWPGSVPQLRVYDTSGREIVQIFDDPVREVDLLDLHEVVRPLPAGIAGARLTNVPRYVKILEYAFNALGWDPAEFRAFRLDVQYPVYGAEYMIGFRLPESPSVG